MTRTLTCPRNLCLRDVDLHWSAPWHLTKVGKSELTIKAISDVVVPPDVAVPRLASTETLSHCRPVVAHARRTNVCSVRSHLHHC